MSGPFGRSRETAREQRFLAVVGGRQAGLLWGNCTEKWLERGEAQNGALGMEGLAGRTSSRSCPPR